MAKPGFDFKKMILASLLVIGIGAVLVILSVVLRLISMVVTDPDITGILDIIVIAYTVLLFPVFLVIYFWAGMRAAGAYGFDAVGAGAVSAFSSLVVGVIQLVLNMLLTLVVVARPLESSGFGTLESSLAASLFGGMMGLKGVGLTAVCGAGVVLFGALINFVVGGFGGLFALRKYSSS
ncbi:hypothetical protein H0O00_03205 [Candidatus Micrarchaeota archaeon]|nr:hypothetical protein [Candidatus Micrarchaeota archaeon]